VDNNGRFVATYTKNEKGKTGGLWDRNSLFLDEYAGTDTLGSGKSQESRVSPSLLDPNAYRAKQSGYDTLKGSYGMVAKLDYTSSGNNADSSYAMAELAEPHRTASFVTALNWLVQYGGRFYWKGEEGKVNAPAPAYRHNNKMLVAYYDGHVGELSIADVKDIDKKGGKNHPFWNGTSSGN
jgi:prepilin-type processing-associated H-X9-DG protein